MVGHCIALPDDLFLEDIQHSAVALTSSGVSTMVHYQRRRDQHHSDPLVRSPVSAEFSLNSGPPSKFVDIHSILAVLELRALLVLFLWLMLRHLVLPLVVLLVACLLYRAVLHLQCYYEKNFGYHDPHHRLNSILLVPLLLQGGDQNVVSSWCEVVSEWVPRML